MTAPNRPPETEEAQNDSDTSRYRDDIVIGCGFVQSELFSREVA